jgi:hypothetical protein
MKQLKQNDNGKLRPHKNKPIKLQQHKHRNKTTNKRFILLQIMVQNII